MHVSPHHLSCRRQPFPSLHNTKRSVPELLEQCQVLLWDEAGERLLAIKRSTSAGLRQLDSLSQGRSGRQLTKRGGWLALLGEVSSVWALTAKHLEKYGRRERRNEAMHTKNKTAH